MLLLCLCLSLGACTALADTTTTPPAPGWSIRWQRGFTTDTLGAVDAPPAADTERVYVAAFERQPAAPWGEQHYLQALDAVAGTPLWRADLGGYGAAAPVVAGDTVYVASIGAGLAALDAGTGRQRWFLPLDGADLSAPLITGDQVYVVEQCNERTLCLAASSNSLQVRLWQCTAAPSRWCRIAGLNGLGKIAAGEAALRAVADADCVFSLLLHRSMLRFPPG